jgi:protein CpxP
MNQPAPNTAPTPQSRRRWFAGLAALGGLGAVGASAQAHGWGGWGRGHRLDPEEMARRMEYRIDRVVKEVNGTLQQKERLVAIARAAMTELRPMREQLRDMRRRGTELLAGASVDRHALEQLRAATIQLADARSRKVVQAMADAAEVFTPAQRTQLAERLKARFGRR